MRTVTFNDAPLDIDANLHTLLIFETEFGRDATLAVWPAAEHATRTADGSFYMSLHEVGILDALRLLWAEAKTVNGMFPSFDSWLQVVPDRAVNEGRGDWFQGAVQEAMAAFLFDLAADAAGEDKAAR